MQKNKVSLEVETNEKRFEFLCSPESQLGEIYDALKQMSQYIVSVIRSIEKEDEEETEGE